MAVFTPLTIDDARALTLSYELGQVFDFAGIQAGSVNSNFALRTERGRYFVRVYEEQERAGAEAEGRLLTYLAERGVATPPPLARRDGALVSTAAGKPAAIFPWREGTMRCQAGVSEEDAARVGAALARVHVAGQHAERGAGRFREEDLAARVARIARADDPALAALAAPLGDALARWSAARDRALPRGLVHGDLFRDNVLWNAEGEIVALLDFESASDGVLAYDLAVTILAWCVGDTLEPRLVRAMTRGYAAVRPLTDAETRGMLAEACAAALRFSITRVTDYAMRTGVGPRVMKDYRRFLMRLGALESLGARGLADAMGA